MCFVRNGPKPCNCVDNRWLGLKLPAMSVRLTDTYEWRGRPVSVQLQGCNSTVAVLGSAATTPSMLYPCPWYLKPP